MSDDSKWYLQRDGKAAGPFSLSDLKSQVRQGLLHGHDLVFKDGADEWTRVFDCAELATEIFTEQRTSFTGLFVLPPSEEDGWVVLIRQQSGKSMRFDQLGPMTTEKVRDLLKSGEAKSTDHVWKKGFDQWVAIFTLPEFSPSLWNLKKESEPLLAAVVETPLASRAPQPEPDPEPLPVIEMPAARPAAIPAIPEAKAPEIKAAEEKPAELKSETRVFDAKKVEAEPSEPKTVKPVLPEARKPEVVPEPTPKVEEAKFEPVRAETVVAPKKVEKEKKPAIPVAKAEITLPDMPVEEFIPSLQVNPGAAAQAKAKRERRPEPPPPSLEEVQQLRRGRQFAMGGREWFIVSVLVVVVFGALPVLKKKFASQNLVLEQAEVPAPNDLLEGSQDQASTALIPTPVPPVAVENAAPAMDLPPAEASAAAKSAEVKAPAPSTNSPAAAKGEVPNMIYTTPQKPSERTVNWTFSPAAEAGSSLLVLITGFSGQVLDANAVNLKVHLFLPASRRLLIEPRSLQLPEGEYLVQIYQGGRALVKSEQRYIVDEDRFERKIAQHRKQIAFDQQSEKRNLLRSLDGLQRFLSSNQAALSGKSNLTPKARSGLQKSLEALQRPEVRKLKQNSHALMYPGGWSSFAAQYEGIRSLLDKAGSRNPAGKPDLDALKKKIDLARAQVSRTSLWSKD